MKRLQISSVSDVSFGVHRDRSVDSLGHDFVCILGPNESGKSTLAEFLQWMIAGPGGDTASAGRFGDPAARIGGRLIGTLETESIDLTATFTLKGNGVPNDARQGYLGDRACDGSSLATLFGQVTAADYRLIHRLRGADLGDSGEAKSFSDVFTRFAIGSDSAGVNPRERLVELQKREKAVAKSLKDNGDSLKKKRAEIVNAGHRPEELVALRAKYDDEVTRRSELGRQLDELRAHEALLRRALGFIPVREQRDGAEIALGQLGPMTDSWRQVARSKDAVNTAHLKVQEQQETVEDCERRFEQKRAEAGVHAPALEGHELSIADRRLLLDAAQLVVSVEATANDARLRRSTLGAQILEHEAEIARAARVLGVEPDTGESLLGRATSIRSLLNEAALWADEDRKATELVVSVAGLQSRLNEASTSQPDASQANARRFPPRFIVAIGGLVLAAAAALVNPLVAVAIAAITVIVALVLPDRSAGVASAISDPAEPIRKALAEAKENLARSQARSSELEESLLLSLATFGASSVTQASLARTHVEQLSDLAGRVDRLAADRATLETLEAEIISAGAEASEARTNLQMLLGDRDIDVVPPIEDFSSWLEGYALALSAARERREASKVLHNLESEREELIAAVLEELGALNWPARIERIRAMHDLLARIEAQEEQLQQAVLKIGFLGDDQERIEEILRSYSDVTALQAQLGEVSEQISKLDGERDEQLTRQNAINDQIELLEGTELLAGLQAERGELEETESELTNELEMLRRSVTILAEVIDRFEVENQDPLFKQTQQLVQRVVPDWGDLVFSRNAKSDVVIERRDESSRLDDSRLSDGARALLYLALRLAFTNADAQRRNIALPILCDDPLVHLDDDRRDGALALLADAARTHQVLLFTCDTSTATLAQQNGAHVVTL